MSEYAEHTYTRARDDGTTYTAVLTEAPGSPGHIDVSREMAASLYGEAQEPMPEMRDVMPGVVSFPVADLHALLTKIGWAKA